MLVGLLLALGCKADLKTGPGTGPAAMAELRGNAQSAEVGSPLPVPPAVLVTNESGAPTEGAIVTFTVTAGGGALTRATDTTGPDGIAEVGGWTLGTVAGPNRVNAAAAGLSGSPVEFTATARPGPPAAAELVDPPPAAVTSGTPFSPQPAVQLKDVYGNPDQLPGSVVTASILQGPGGVLQGTVTAVTDAQGAARFTDLRLEGPVGDYTLGFNSLTLPAVSATTHVNPGAPASISRQAGDNQGAATGTAVAVNPSVLVRDAFDNPVPGVSVAFAVASGGGSIAGSPAVTGPNGIAASGAWTLGPAAGANTLSATVSGVGSVVFTATGSTAPPASINKVAGDAQTSVAGSALPESLVVQVRDAGGVGVPAVTVNWTVLTGGGAVSPASAVTDASGQARVRWTTGVVAGANSVRASAGALTATFTAGGIAGPAAGLAMVIEPGGGPSGGVLAPQPQVRAVDGNGNAAGSGTVVTAALNSGGGTLTGTAAATTNGSGIATFVALGISGTVGTRTLVFTAPGLASVTSAGFAITAGAAAALAKEAGDNQTATAGAPVPVNPVVSVRDGAGNPVAGVSVSFAVASGGGSIGAALATTDAQGLASGGAWTLGAAAGPNTLTATVSGLAGSPATFTATGTTAPPGAPAAIVKVGGDGQTDVAGEAAAESLVVQVRDASGLGVPGVTVSWTVLTGSGTVAAGVRSDRRQRSRGRRVDLRCGRRLQQRSGQCGRVQHILHGDRYRGARDGTPHGGRARWWSQRRNPFPATPGPRRGWQRQRGRQRHRGHCGSGIGGRCSDRGAHRNDRKQRSGDVRIAGGDRYRWTAYPHLYRPRPDAGDFGQFRDHRRVRHYPGQSSGGQPNRSGEHGRGGESFGERVGWGGQPGAWDHGGVHREHRWGIDRLGSIDHGCPGPGLGRQLDAGARGRREHIDGDCVRSPG